MASARTAAVAVRSTQTISCGDGSSSDCIREDTKTEKLIQDIASQTDIWRYFEEAPPSKADIILQFVANERASSSAQITLRVQDSDSGTWRYYESRTVTDMENDVQRLVDHFIAKSNRTPIRSKEAVDKARTCAEIADHLSALKSRYQKQRDDYEFKNAHLLDAQMEECKLHWKEWVCLKRGGSEGFLNYAEQWNESGQELRRKLLRQYEELQDLEKQISALSFWPTCPQTP